MWDKMLELMSMFQTCITHGSLIIIIVGGVLGKLFVERKKEFEIGVEVPPPTPKPIMLFLKFYTMHKPSKFLQFQDQRLQDFLLCNILAHIYSIQGSNTKHIFYI